MKVLYVASEAVPFIKTGGLADVAFSLPKELRKTGVDIRVVIPKYSAIAEEFKKEMVLLKSIEVPVGWREQYCGIEYMEYEGVPYYFIDNEYYFKRDSGYGVYGYYDEAERFSFFNKSVLEMIKHIDFKPDIIHCNDWHTGMISPLLKAQYSEDKDYKNIKTIFTIHNLKYQGIFSSEILGDLLNLGSEYNHIEKLEFNGGVSFMKGGINYSDIVTTVSKSYAEEIQCEYYGEKLDGLLRKRGKDLFGIVNGIDYDIYNPEKDSFIYENYNIDSFDKKIKNKLKLQEAMNLPQREDVPLIGIVSRLDSMKGLDLVVHILDELLAKDVQMVVLGTGDQYFESIFRNFASRYPHKLSSNILFNTSLAHKIYASCDMFLMPSRFEPCGLSQLIALRYGTLPIVRETGGLNDTVKSFNEFTMEGNGFSFKNYNAHDMLFTINRALEYYKDRTVWYEIVKNAMNGDYSWKVSAQTYEELYLKLI
ncbi:glycogen synthase GlgA [Oceanirhabdus sp. W0125-5]|uniref:glycogen synthase GlgA n=1 Tax=Oceanirhabdus sp. W0125-5 TaxID=2999116 RepID=UPI0022F342F2|nr:glycogen synthase GlgA [Oceanirhabdus sp. W0125-5]WBW99816.1 glycogen synthase GlgA [Oceanirhabdus sp. W0125-5]